MLYHPHLLIATPPPFHPTSTPSPPPPPPRPVYVYFREQLAQVLLFVSCLFSFLLLLHFILPTPCVLSVHQVFAFVSLLSFVSVKEQVHDNLPTLSAGFCSFSFWLVCFLVGFCRFYFVSRYSSLKWGIALRDVLTFWAMCTVFCIINKHSCRVCIVRDLLMLLAFLFCTSIVNTH